MALSAVDRLINEQVTKEFNAAYLYLSMSAYCDTQNLPGFASWMRHQYEEELSHALRFLDYLLEKGTPVELGALTKPAATFKGPLDVMKQSLAHEKRVTASINKIYDAAVKAKDYPAQVMLQWFVTEQVEEERSVGDVIAKLEMIGDHKPALVTLDRELGQRSAEREH